MKDYVVNVKNGSTDKIRVEKYLKNLRIKYEESEGVFDSTYIRFKTNKSTWKRIKNDLGLTVDAVYSKFKLV